MTQINICVSIMWSHFMSLSCLLHNKNKFISLFMLSACYPFAYLLIYFQRWLQSTSSYCNGFFYTEKKIYYTKWVLQQLDWGYDLLMLRTCVSWKLSFAPYVLQIQKCQVNVFYNELQWNWNTQKAQNRSSVGVPWQGVSSQVRILELMGTRSLPTPGLCQPRSLLEP